MTTHNKKKTIIPLGVGFMLLAAVQAHAAVLAVPATGNLESIYGLGKIILGLCAVIFVGVFGAMGYILIFHRKSVRPTASQFHGSTLVEIIWTAIPLVVLIAIAIPATGLLFKLRDTSKEDLHIIVRGYQWKWEYEYPDAGFRFMSNLSTSSDAISGKKEKGEHYLIEVDRPMVVPAGKKVKLVLTAMDVIHSWWVPPFGVKQDAIPGFINETWFKVDKPGVYRGQCAELCGKDHGFMPVVVQALPEDKFQAWLEQAKTEYSKPAVDYGKTYTLDELKVEGEKIYKTTCVACHQANGQGIPGVFKPIAGSAIVNGPKEKHLQTVLDGVKGTAMAAFKNQMNDFEIAAVATFERNSFGNATGDAVQPAEVRDLRQ